ncbi:MAG: PQQ-dependent sugar dehydrogenase [Nocardioides sp.]
MNDAIGRLGASPCSASATARPATTTAARIAFDKAGLLYVSPATAAAAKTGHAQDRRSLLGKVLPPRRRPRVALHHPRRPARCRHKQGRPEIWAIRPRNPWRMAFDPASRSMWVGDVVADTVEEVDRLRSPGSDYSTWAVALRAARVFDRGRRLRGGKLVKPVLSYRHPVGESIIGGAVYPARQLPPAPQGPCTATSTAGSPAFDRRPEPLPGSTRAPACSRSRRPDKELCAGYADGTVYRITAD